MKQAAAIVTGVITAWFAVIGFVASRQSGEQPLEAAIWHVTQLVAFWSAGVFGAVFAVSLFVVFEPRKPPARLASED